ncbi:Gfo/Idh/MocA family protein [Paucisalibacillus globulus]|uniref:Gfo/Idh/MocA family protein n=1 Tax=Paucisalibacillus globulus TaxID=351095 RepID=UPI000408D652|nr:Gfo/Idh/MocA family oxidoreductase [Paucisalibacillus globulus]
MTKVKFGILSTAGIAQQALIPAFQRSTNAEVVAIASESGMHKARAVAEKYDIKHAYDSYEKLLDDPYIDAVYIPLPNHLHKKWVLEAALRGKHILCEKPAALHTDELLEMKQVCEENHVIFMEAFMYQFHPQHERVRQIIDSGEIGTVQYMRAGFSFLLTNKGNNIRMDVQKGGGSLYDIGCYPIHSIRHILRSEPETVHVHAKVDPDYNVDTDVVVHVTFPDGIRATFDASFNYAMRHEYEVIGTKGSIVVPRAYRPDLHGGDGLVIVNIAGVSRVETWNGDQYRNEVEYLSDAILSGASDRMRNKMDESIRAMRVMDACYQSIRTGQQVLLN